MAEYLHTLPRDHQLIRDALSPNTKTRMAATVILATMDDYLALKREYPSLEGLALACAWQANREYRQRDFVQGPVWALLGAGFVPPTSAQLLELVPDFMDERPQDPFEKLGAANVYDDCLT